MDIFYARFSFALIVCTALFFAQNICNTARILEALELSKLNPIRILEAVELSKLNTIRILEAVELS